MAVPPSSPAPVGRRIVPDSGQASGHVAAAIDATEEPTRAAKVVAPPPNLPMAPEPEDVVAAKRPLASDTPAPSPIREEADRFALPDLPPAARTFLISEHYRESDAALARSFGLTAEDISFLNEMDHLVLGNALPLDGYVRALRAEFPLLDTATRDKLIARLLADRFLPWGDALKPSARAVAEQETLTLPTTSYYVVYFKPLTYAQAAEEVAKMVGLPLAGQTRDRLRDVLVSRVKGVRLEPQVEAQLMRSVETGGLGLEPERARATVIALNDLLLRTKVLPDDTYAAWVAAQGGGAPNAGTGSSSATPSAASKAATPVDVLAEEDAKEIAAMAARTPPRPASADALRQSVQAALARLSWKPEDPYVRRRLENIVSTRMRDVRSRNEVLLTAMRDVKVGGLGLDRMQADTLAAEVEAAYGELHGAVAQEEEAARAVQEATQAARAEDRKRQEVEEHARWFEERSRQQKTGEAVGGSSAAAPMHPVDRKERIRERVAFGDMVETTAGVRPAGVGTVAAALGYAPSMAPTADPTPTSTVKISAASVAADAAARPRMEDVRPVRTPTAMTGPIQELRGMTLAAFRRLAKTPEGCAARVRQIIDLIGQESFPRRGEAVRAWQESPLQRQYLTLVAQAFSAGTPLQALLDQKKATGEDVPSAAEMNAIVSLNVGL